jgi:hypothetical protein
VHRSSLVRYLAAVVSVSALGAGPVVGAVLDIPFDFSRGAIGMDVTVHGVPLFVILDTGVDPSVIASARAESLGLKVDRLTMLLNYRAKKLTFYGSCPEGSPSVPRA